MKAMITICSLFLLSLAPLQAGKLDRSKVPQPGPAPEIKLGNYTSFELDNGLKVFVVENRKLPRISFTMNLAVDPVHEGDAVGYLDALGSILRRGTTTRSKQEIDDAVDFIGASLGASSRSLSGSSLKKYSDTILELMADIAMNASFPEDELTKIKKEMSDGIRSSANNADAIAGNVADVLLYGKDHPYGTVATEDSVEKISVGHLRQYYQTYWRPNVAYLAVVGDTNAEEARTMIEKHFGSWRKLVVPRNEWPTPKAPEKTKIAVVHKEGAVQTVLQVLNLVDIKPGSPDAIPARVTNTILGGGTFRLYRNLREDKAYTYGAYSRISNDRLIGSFTAQASVRNEVTKPSVKEFLYELNRIRNEKVPEDELSLVKNYLTGTFALALENPSLLASYAINISRYNLPRDYYDNYLKNLAAVDADSVQAMAKKHIQPGTAWILAVGDADMLTKELAEYGEVHRFEINGDPYVEPSVVVPEGMTVEKIIDTYLEKVGGRDVVSKLQDLTIEGEMDMGGMQAKMINRFRSPNQTATDMMMNGQVMGGSKFDGEKGADLQMGQQNPFDEKKVLQIQKTAHPFTELNFGDDYFTLELAGVAEVEGKNAYHIKVKQGGEANMQRYYDMETGLLLKVIQVVESQMGKMTQGILFDDYREVEGMKFPFKQTVSFGPRNIVVNVKKITANQGLDDSHFKLD